MDFRIFILLLVQYFLLISLYWWMFEVNSNKIILALNKKLELIEQASSILKMQVEDITEKQALLSMKVEELGNDTESLRFEFQNEKEFLEKKIEDAILAKPNPVVDVPTSNAPAIWTTKKFKNVSPQPPYEFTTFNLTNYKGKDVDFIMNEYKRFHNTMTAGLISPRYLIMHENVDGSGFGNTVERMATALVVAMLTSRALLIDYTITYAITNLIFDPPGFDWVYHQHPREQDISIFQAESILWYAPSYEEDWTTAIPLQILSFETKPVELVETRKFQEIIPYTLRNWKSEAIAMLFSNPVEKIQSDVNKLKQQMKENGYDHFLSIQFRSVFMNEKGPQDASRFFGCANYFLKDDPNCAVFLAADNTNVKALAKENFGRRYFQFDVTPAGPGENLGGILETTNQIGALTDWYMLGEAIRIFTTAASSFGASAADRGRIMTFPERFHIGGLTQCTDTEKPYYLEQIFFSPMDTFNKTGKMEWLQYVH